MLNFVVFNKLHHTLFHSTFVLRIITLDRMSPFPFLAHLKASILFQMKRKLWNFSHQFFTKSRQGSTIFNNYVSILPRNKYNVADTKKERKVLSVCVLPVSKVVLAQIGTTNQHTVVKNIKFAMLQSYKKNKKKKLCFSFFFAGFQITQYCITECPNKFRMKVQSLLGYPVNFLPIVSLNLSGNNRFLIPRRSGVW